MKQDFHFKTGIDYLYDRQIIYNTRATVIGLIINLELSKHNIYIINNL